jgi:phosphoribosylformylglycinamidine synthase
MSARVAVLRMEGTNNEQDMLRAFAAAGGDPEYVHIKQLTDRVPADRQVDLLDFDVLAIPGGFSAGDYVRAGAIFAARLEAQAGDQLRAFHEEERPILGVCNGFQVLVELGLLPGENGQARGEPAAALTMNESDTYECRPSLLAAGETNCPFLAPYEDADPVMFPSAHAEGRLELPDPERLDELAANGQIAFRYTGPEGSSAYPWNPNGSPGDVAALSDPTGTVLGIMPHPDRAIHAWQHPDWTRSRDPEDAGDGRALFEAIVDHA